MSISSTSVQGSTFPRFLNLQRNELPFFLLVSLTLFCISASNVLFNNFAETAFLKRFGVHFLPTLLLINAGITLVVMSFVSRLLSRYPGQRVLGGVLFFCALSAAVARLVIPFDFKLLYPVVYIMKTQYEILSTFLFWNLANQIFSTRQAKRMFPLIVSAGIIGGLSGSLSTPWIARLGSLDNILWAYLAGMGFAVFLISQLNRVILQRDESQGKPYKPKTESNFLADIRKALPVMKASKLVRWLVLLTLIPNMVVPLLNYQVSFAIDMTYSGETAMLGFFSLYRSAQFALALIVSLFAGRLYSRFGLSGGLLVHPFNYLMVFVVFMFQFDILTVIYAGISVGVIRRAIQTPARAALIGLFPQEQRVMLMPFLRGVVVRLGTLVGATFVFICQAGYFVVCRFPLHPQNLAPFGFGFAALWLYIALRMRKSYLELVLETLGWHGPERGRLKIPASQQEQIYEQLSALKLRLAQAAAIKQLGKNPIMNLLTECLSSSANRQALDILQILRNEDLSGRLQTVYQAIKGDDSRRRSNALEVLEQLVPVALARDLILALEKKLEKIKAYSGDILEALTMDREEKIKALALQIQQQRSEINH